MANKMLIDASHPEETRVAVVRGNRIEEFDFESQEKKQLRGNIYLAKVTRVEPSLQAAFIDYGGNRHGFLAFSEIHPDYYQIPVADRQALLEAEAEEALASQKAEDAELDGPANEEQEKPKRKSRRRTSKKAAAEEKTEVEASQESPTVENSTGLEKAEEEPEGTVEDVITAESSDDAKKDAVEAKPKRRTTRRKKKVTAENSDEESLSSSEDDDSAEPNTIAAIVESDSISEPLPGEEESDETDGSEEEASASNSEEVVEAKPKRKPRTRRKKPQAKTTEPDDVEVAEQSAEEKTESAAENQGDEEEDVGVKPAKPRRRSRRKKAVAEESHTDSNSTDNSNDTAAEDTELSEEDEDIESVGQEDALEEAAAPRKARKQYKIQEVIKRRQVLLVQVVKEERGNKGAALTTYLSLAGRYSVLMPNTARGGGISRKITNAADRKRLKTIASELEVPTGMGVILRTAGASRTKVEINRDFQYLMRLWEQVRNLTLSSTAPCLVYEEGSLIKRSIRDLYDKDTGEILVSGEEGYNEARDFMGMLMPSHVKKVNQYNDSKAIFAKYGVESLLDNMVAPQVTLKSGGYLVINQTEALVAIDVNSGRATREHSIENTALQTNLEAAEEAARQLRLRDLAGLIVIDFIDMEERRNNRAVEKKLKDCLKNDRARIQVGRISHFGLLEMSRQRIRASVLESTMNTCPHCAGVGYVRSESAIALHVFRALEEHVTRNKKWDAVVRTTPDIAVHILNHKRSALVELEQKFGVQILVLGDTNLHGQQFELGKGDRARTPVGQTAIGYDGEDTSNGASLTAEENEESGQKRGRRRKRSGRNDEIESAESETTDSDEDTKTATEADQDDDKPRKKRRRGKRGGRRRKEDESSDIEVTAETETAEIKSEKSDTPAPQDSSPDSSSQEEKPVRRSTRRKKAPIAKPADPKPDEAEVVAEANISDAIAETVATESEEPKQRRRTTRRKTKNESSETSSLSAETGNTSNATDAGTEEENSEKTSRSGWWSRGGSFF
ncbi:MAG: Rne/Rng family ribonuclease [Rhizobiaceae bacterium]